MPAKNDNMVLVSMRVVDMREVHPQQDNSHKCGQCGQRVGLYPSSQRMLRRFPGLKIKCGRCATGDKFDAVRPAARDKDEFDRERAASAPVQKT